MQITDVRIRKVEKEGKMKAVVSITIDEEFVVHDIKIIEGEKGLFIAMPSRKAADGDSGSFFAYVDEKNIRIHAEIKVAFLTCQIQNLL